MADQMHDHDAQLHEHEHAHVTHYQRAGEDVSHLTATHSQEHNRPGLTHANEAHEGMDKEHGREAHIHDRAQPAQSPP